MGDVYILSAVRTPIGKFGGSLASMSAADMGVVAAKAAMERAGVQPEQVEETIFGNARQAGGGPNPARQISIRSGVPQEVPAYTVNKACASGLKSIALGYQEIATGNLDCVLAGGTESMSRVPYYLDGARWGYRLGNQELVDGMYRDGFFCPMAKMVMGETAESSPSSTRSPATSRTSLRSRRKPGPRRRLPRAASIAKTRSGNARKQEGPSEFSRATSIPLPMRRLKSWPNFLRCSPRQEQSRQEILPASPMVRPRLSSQVRRLPRRTISGRWRVFSR